MFVVVLVGLDTLLAGKVALSSRSPLISVRGTDVSFCLVPGNVVYPVIGACGGSADPITG
jgi:hypothetical protein